MAKVGHHQQPLLRLEDVTKIPVSPYSTPLDVLAAVTKRAFHKFHHPTPTPKSNSPLHPPPPLVIPINYFRPQTSKSPSHHQQPPLPPRPHPHPRYKINNPTNKIHSSPSNNTIKLKRKPSDHHDDNQDYHHQLIHKKAKIIKPQPRPQHQQRQPIVRNGGGRYGGIMIYREPSEHRLPSRMQACIDRIKHPDSEPVLVMQKTLTKSDIKRDQNRFLMPLTRLLNHNFITETEKAELEKRDNLIGIPVKLIGPSGLDENTVTLKKWHMKKTSGGCTHYYALNGSWGSVIEVNGLVTHTTVQLWAFRDARHNLRFALVNVSESGAQTSGSPPVAAETSGSDGGSPPAGLGSAATTTGD